MEPILRLTSQTVASRATLRSSISIGISDPKDPLATKEVVRAVAVREEKSGRDEYGEQEQV